MIVVQIKTPFNISDLKTSLLLLVLFYFVLLFSSIILFPYPPRYFCSSPNFLTGGEPSPDPFSSYRSFLSFLSLASFVPAFIYYFMKNKLEFFPAILLLVILILLTAVCVSLSIYLSLFLNFFSIDFFRGKSVDLCSNL